MASPRRRPDPDDEAGPPPDAAVRPLDPRRIREIQKWLDGSRPDAPTRGELREFETWVSGEIEWHLSRHQPVRELLAYLNAAREQIRAAGG